MRLTARTKFVSAFGVALLLIVGTGAFSWLSTDNLVADAQLVDHTHEVIENLGDIVSQLKDAETGQRGFVITGESRYLEPYDAGLEGVAVAVANVRILTIDNASQQSLLDDMEPLIQRKLDELSQTIELRRTTGFETALAVVITDDGKRTMDELRAIVSVMEQEERRLREQRAEATASTATITKFAVVIGTIMSTSIFSTIAIFLLWTNSKLDQEVVVRTRTEAQREALIVELESKNAELERFTYTVSHDLRSPLITIKGFLGALGQDVARGDTQRMQDDMDRISAAADTMARLLEELLQLSRIGHVAGPPEELALGELAEEAVALVGGLLENNQVRVTILDELPLVFGDRLRIREVLQNLVENAVKFMGEEPNPLVEIGGLERYGESVCFVRDNGMGIDPRYNRKVFDLFDQLDRAAEGTGIGLALVKRIVEVHGGRVWVESEGLGQGSTFYFTLPNKLLSQQNKGGVLHDEAVRSER